MIFHPNTPRVKSIQNNGESRLFGVSNAGFAAMPYLCPGTVACFIPGDRHPYFAVRFPHLAECLQRIENSAMYIILCSFPNGVIFLSMFIEMPEQSLVV